MKSIWVAAHFKELGSWRATSIQTGTTTKMVEKGLFKKTQVEVEVPVFEEQREWVSSGFSDCEVDGERFSKDIGSAIESLDLEGFEVLSITPVLSGSYKYDFRAPVISAFKVVPQQGIKVAKKASKAVGVDLLASRRSSR